MDAKTLLHEAFPFLADLKEEWQNSPYAQDEDRVEKLCELVSNIRGYLHPKAPPIRVLQRDCE